MGDKNSSLSSKCKCSSTTVKKNLPDVLKNSSDFSDSEEDNNEKMEKLQIGSPGKNHQTYSTIQRCSDVQQFRHGGTPVESLAFSRTPSPPLLMQQQSRGHSPCSASCGGIWSDYPQVPMSQGPSSCYSYYSGPGGGGGGQYPGAGLMPTNPPSYNYRSSSMATVFGGRKPLISPPKLSLGGINRQSGQMYSSFGSYGIFYSGSPGLNLSPPPPYCNPNPLSRSSSQSSGFVSLSGGMSTPTHSRFSTAPNSLYSDNEALAGPSSFPQEYRARNEMLQKGLEFSTFNNRFSSPSLSPEHTFISSSYRKQKDDRYSEEASLKRYDCCSRLGQRDLNPPAGVSNSARGRGLPLSEEEDAVFSDNEDKPARLDDHASVKSSSSMKRRHLHSKACRRLNRKENGGAADSVGESESRLRNASVIKQFLHFLYLIIIRVLILANVLFFFYFLSNVNYSIEELKITLNSVGESCDYYCPELVKYIYKQAALLIDRATMYDHIVAVG